MPGKPHVPATTGAIRVDQLVSSEGSIPQATLNVFFPARLPNLYSGHQQHLLRAIYGRSAGLEIVLDMPAPPALLRRSALIKSCAYASGTESTANSSSTQRRRCTVVLSTKGRSGSRYGMSRLSRTSQLEGWKRARTNFCMTIALTGRTIHQPHQLHCLPAFIVESSNSEHAEDSPSQQRLKPGGTRRDASHVAPGSAPYEPGNPLGEPRKRIGTVHVGDDGIPGARRYLVHSMRCKRNEAKRSDSAPCLLKIPKAKSSQKQITMPASRFDRTPFRNPNRP